MGVFGEGGGENGDLSSEYSSSSGVCVCVFAFRGFARWWLTRRGRISEERVFGDEPFLCCMFYEERVEPLGVQLFSSGIGMVTNLTVISTIILWSQT